MKIDVMILKYGREPRAKYITEVISENPYPSLVIRLRYDNIQEQREDLPRIKEHYQCDKVEFFIGR